MRLKKRNSGFLQRNRHLSLLLPPGAAEAEWRLAQFFGERIKQGGLEKKRDVEVLRSWKQHRPRSWGPWWEGSIHSTRVRIHVEGKNTFVGCLELLGAGGLFGSDSLS